VQPVPSATEYVNSASRAGASRGHAVAGEQPLVTTPISEHRLEIFPRSVRVVRPQTGNRECVPPDRSGSFLSGFSSKSRSRLRFTAVNAFPALCSQFGLTYHNGWPTDGRECKRHLHAFLVTLRRLAPSALYLWLLEFQKRNAPHFHLFLTIPPDPQLQAQLAAAWVRITGGTPEALAFHSHSNNWIPWVINNGSYLCKYLDKEAQKSIPDGYINFGRFWGNSSNLVPAPIVTPTAALSAYDQLDEATGELCQGETYILRNLGRLADRQTRGFSRFRQRAHRSSYTILNGTPALFQLERYLGRLTSKRRREVIPDDVPF
jgi:hypothetical protein